MQHRFEQKLGTGAMMAVRAAGLHDRAAGVEVDVDIDALSRQQSDAAAGDLACGNLQPRMRLAGQLQKMRAVVIDYAIPAADRVAGVGFTAGQSYTARVVGLEVDTDLSVLAGLQTGRHAERSEKTFVARLGQQVDLHRVGGRKVRREIRPSHAREMGLYPSDRHPHVAVGPGGRDTTFADGLDMRAHRPGLTSRGIRSTAWSMAPKAQQHQ